MDARLPVGITMGCPVGVGPEIICRYFAHRHQSHPAVVIGEPEILTRVASRMHLPLAIRAWRPGQPAWPDAVPVVDQGTRLDPSTLRWGQPTPETGQAMVAWIRQAVDLARGGALSGLVTCPIAKSALRAAGFPWPGHTEMLAEWTGSRQFRMMMSGERLRVVLVTIHEPLARVAQRLGQETILDCLRMTGRSLCVDFGLDRPRIGVAGFNPHSGEGGLFGREEIDKIIPALDQYDGPGSVSGPWPPDTIFYRAVQGEFDAVVAMYHDQGLIPFKLIHFRDGVNVTLGLPIVRTSVDHGTAYDIAGQGIADPASLEAAVDTAVRIADNRRRHDEQGQADRL